MEKISKLFFALTICMAIHSTSYSQNMKEEWKDYLKDGYRLSSRVVNTDSSQIIEYKLFITSKIDLEHFYKTMINPDNYRHFFQNNKENKIVQFLSDSEFITYSFYDTPWPLPDSDCVNHTKIEKNTVEKSVIVSNVAAPDKYKKINVKRRTLNYYTIRAKSLPNDSTEIYMHSRCAATVQAPKWMVMQWFPKGPIKTMDKMILFLQENDISTKLK